MAETKDTKLPKKITPDPIVEAIIELRFNSKVDPDAVFYFVSQSKVIKEQFKQPEELPIYQLPPSVRNNEPGLRYSPYYRLQGIKSYADYLVQVGPRAISIVASGEYKGSSDFLDKALNLFNSIGSQDVIHEAERLGIRYIDFFESNIFQNIKLNVSIPGSELSHENSSARLELPKVGRFGLTLQLASGAKIQVKKEGKEKTGSVLDIDAYTSEFGNDWTQNLEELLKEGHLAQKKLFFGLITDNFFKTFKVEY